MALRINYNLAASVAQRSLGASQDNYARQAEKLATGLRINKAGDDAAGMAVSERLKNQVRGLNQAAAQRPRRHLHDPDGRGRNGRGPHDPRPHA